MYKQFGNAELIRFHDQNLSISMPSADTSVLDLCIYIIYSYKGVPNVKWRVLLFRPSN